MGANSNTLWVGSNDSRKPFVGHYVLARYIDGYGNFCDYDVLQYGHITAVANICGFMSLGTIINASKVASWLQIENIPAHLWNTLQDARPKENSFAVCEVYRTDKLDAKDTRLEVMEYRHLSCKRFTGVGFLRYNLYTEDTRIVRWCNLTDLILL